VWQATAHWSTGAGAQRSPAKPGPKGYAHIQKNHTIAATSPFFTEACHFFIIRLKKLKIYAICINL
jgi:hypothetical protein